MVCGSSVNEGAAEAAGSAKIAAKGRIKDEVVNLGIFCAALPSYICAISFQQMVAASVP
jgi:hypothetical protein